MFERGTGGCEAVRLLAAGVVLSVGLVIGTPRCAAADVWGGSLGITSDYIVRGISRSNDQAALQLELHYLNTSGFVAGLFASNTQIDPNEPKRELRHCFTMTRPAVAGPVPSFGASNSSVDCNYWVRRRYLRGMTRHSLEVAFSDDRIGQKFG
jgi:hypothetical protein